MKLSRELIRSINRDIGQVMATNKYWLCFPPKVYVEDSLVPLVGILPYKEGFGPPDENWILVEELE